jgi:hypothetical protein
MYFVKCAAPSALLPFALAFAVGLALLLRAKGPADRRDGAL